MAEFSRRRPTNGPGLSLESVKDFAISGNPQFSWANPRYIAGNFQTVIQAVKDSINHDLPHILSVSGGRSGNTVNFHMLTVVGYDEASAMLRVHDTETPVGGQNPRDVRLAQIRADLLQVHLWLGRIGDDSTDSLVIQRL